MITRGNINSTSMFCGYKCEYHAGYSHLRKCEYTLPSYNVDARPLQILVLLLQSFTAITHRFQFHAQYAVFLLQRLDAHRQLFWFVGLHRRCSRRPAVWSSARYVYRWTARITLHVTTERHVRHLRNGTVVGDEISWVSSVGRNCVNFLIKCHRLHSTALPLTITGSDCEFLQCKHNKQETQRLRHWSRLCY